MFLLNKELFFPPLTTADEDGLLAIGGDLSTERLLLPTAVAYSHGITNMNRYAGGVLIPVLFYILMN